MKKNLLFEAPPFQASTLIEHEIERQHNTAFHQSASLSEREPEPQFEIDDRSSEFTINGMKIIQLEIFFSLVVQ